MKKNKIAAVLLTIITALPITARQRSFEELLGSPYLKSGITSLEESNFRDAEYAFKDCVNKEKDNFIGWLFLSYAQRNLDRDCKEIMKASNKGYDLSLKYNQYPGFVGLHTDNILHCEKDTSKAEDIIFNAIDDAEDDEKGDLYKKLYFINISRNDTVMASRYLDNAIALTRSSFLYLMKSDLEPVGSDSRLRYLNLAIENAEDTSDYCEALRNRIICYISRDQYRKAIDDALEMYGYQPGETINIAMNLMETDPEYAKSRLIELCKAEENESNWFTLFSRFASSVADYDTALEFALRSINIEQGPYEYEVLANAYKECDDYENALAYYNKSMSEDVPFLWNRAECLIELGESDKAIELLDQALLKGDDSEITHIRYLLAVAYMNKGEYEKAIENFDQVNTELEYSFLPSLVMGGDACQKTGNTLKANDLYDKAISICNTDIISAESEIAQGWLPLALAAVGRETEANKIVDTIFANATDENEAVLYQCACYYTRTGNYKKGLEALRMALDKGFDTYHPEVDYDLAHLRSYPEFSSMIKNARNVFRKKMNNIEEKALKTLN